MGKIAFLFAGQGAQHPGMGQALYQASPAARQALDASEQVRPGTLKQCFQGPEEELTLTLNTQPCLFAVDYACAAAARERGIEPDCLAGFSLGEVAAAAFGGVFSFEEGMRLVMRRAQLMQDCAQAHPGAMLAVLRLSPAQVEAICRQAGQAYPVNYNCPGQTVVACAREVAEQVSQLAAAQRGRALPLKVSGAFHSPWMEEAGRGLAAYLADMTLSQPSLPLYANATAQPYGQDGRQAAGLLARQVYSPVRWQDTLERMAQAGVDTFVEVGAGTTLSGLVRKTLPQAAVYNVSDPQSLEQAWEGIVHGA